MPAPTPIVPEYQLVDSDFIDPDFRTIINNLCAIMSPADIANYCSTREYQITGPVVRKFKLNKDAQPTFKLGLRLIALHSLVCPGQHGKSLDFRSLKELNKLLVTM